jgi:uncharacterized iron-regulated membrane protein
MYQYRHSIAYRRWVALLLIAACQSGCYTWRPLQTAPGQVLTVTPGSNLRITRSDDSQVIVTRPEVRGDTLVGKVHRTGTSWDGVIFDDVRIPLNDIRAVSNHRFSGWRTAGFFIVAVFGFGLMVVSMACPCIA